VNETYLHERLVVRTQEKMVILEKCGHEPKIIIF